MDALNQLRQPLAELATACRARAFSFPDFLLPWCAAAATEGQSPLCLCAWQGGDLVGFLPLFARREAKALMARRLSPPRYGASLPFELLIAPEADRDAVLDRLADTVNRTGWFDMVFRDEPADSAVSTEWAARYEKPGFAINRTAQHDFFVIRGCAGSEEYLTKLRRKKRMELQRQERRFHEVGHLALFTGQDDDLERAIADMRHVVRHSWKYDARMEQFGLPLTETLMREMAPCGHMRLWLAYHADQPVSMLLEFADDSGSRHAYFNATNQASGYLDAGITTLFNACKQSLDDGVPEYDFWGYRSYIKQFSTGTREIRTLSISRKGPFASLCRSALMMGDKRIARRKASG